MLKVKFNHLIYHSTDHNVQLVVANQFMISDGDVSSCEHAIRNTKKVI